MIQTAPSTVARQIAPWRCATISPGAPRSASSRWTPKRWNSLPADRVEHARVALGGADAADHGRGRVGAPVDRAVGLPDQRTRAAGHARVARSRRRSGAAPPAATAVTASTTASIAARRTSWRYRLLLPASRVRNVRARPDVAAVDLAGRLEHRHAPLRHPELDRPVERGRPAVALRAGVHDQAAVPLQTTSGMIVLSIGQTISSGAWRATAASIAALESTTSTATRGRAR